jgi:hypothetical protein
MPNPSRPAKPAVNVLVGWGTPLLAFLNLQFPGIRIQWPLGDVLVFAACLVAPVILLVQCLRWPEGNRRGWLLVVTVPIVVVSTLALGATAFELSWNGAEPNCTIIASAVYAGTDVAVQHCCDGGSLGHCSADAIQEWHLLPGVRVQRQLGGVYRGYDVRGFVVASDTLSFTASTSDGPPETVNVKLRRWLWL